MGRLLARLMEALRLTLAQAVLTAIFMVCDAGVAGLLIAGGRRSWGGFLAGVALVSKMWLAADLAWKIHVRRRACRIAAAAEEIARESAR